MMGGYGAGYGAGYGTSWVSVGMMWFFGLLIVGGIVLLIVWLARSVGHQGAQGPPPSSANDPCAIAKVRYAKGEITKEQYEEICRTLGV
jgi:putative membrane protein